MTDRELNQAAAAIEKIRALRVRPPRDTTAAGAVGELHDALERQIKQTGGMGEAWRTVAPDNLRDKARVVSFQRGVLTIETPDTGTRYLIEQWLRAGGRQMLTGCAPATLRRVVVTAK